MKHAYEEADITAVPTFVIDDTKIAGVRSKEAPEQIINEKLDKQIPQQLFNEGISCGIDEC